MSWNNQQLRNWELAQQIEKLIEVTDMELEHESQREDTNMMPKEPQVIL